MLIERNGAKRWRLKYRTGGVERPLAIGTFPNTSLANARDARGATRKLSAEGKDPNEATRERVVTELAASAIGMGTIANGQAFISLGKSGVFFSRTIVIGPTLSKASIFFVTPCRGNGIRWRLFFPRPVVSVG